MSTTPSNPSTPLPNGPIAAKQTTDAHHAVWTLLEAVTDPEIPVVSLREMGVLRAVREGADGLLEVVITPTYSGCPAMDQIGDDVRAALAQAGLKASVVTQLAPAWSTEWMTPEGREKLRAYGIAPPPVGTGSACGHSVIQFATKNIAKSVRQTVACPQCSSENTTEISHFGSTACKALYKCLDCLEPFDYFKPY